MEAAGDTTWTGYSIAERDRRWAAVRANAATAGFDCILVPPGDPYDARYVGDMANAAIILPTAGGTPLAIRDRGRPNAWIPEARSTRGAYAPGIVQALIEAGMERGRIGVTGLRGGRLAHVRAPEGMANYTSLTEVMKQLPNATFEDATDVVGASRYVKGEEEIDCLRRAAAIAEAGIDEMIEIARPGVDAAVLYGRVSGRLLELGSEHYRHGLALSIKDPEERHETRYTEPPLRRRLKAGTLIENEVSAVWGGMVAQEDQPILLAPTPEPLKPIIELQREIFEAGLAFMKPGVTFGELIDFTNGFGTKRGMKTQTLMHGRGNSDDGPLITPSSPGDPVRDIRIEKGNAWVWKPYGMSADGSLEFVWGGDVVVTDHGGERLFNRAHGLVSIT